MVFSTLFPNLIISQFVMNEKKKIHILCLLHFPPGLNTDLIIQENSINFFVKKVTVEKNIAK